MRWSRLAGTIHTPRHAMVTCGTQFHRSASAHRRHSCSSFLSMTRDPASVSGEYPAARVGPDWPRARMYNSLPYVKRWMASFSSLRHDNMTRG